jgi:uncharacterized protein YgiM (DUF1202 family)
MGHTIKATGASQNGWTPVSYQGRKGWVSTQYFISPGQKTAAATGSKGQYRTLANVNVRTGPSTSYNAVDVLTKNAKVTLTGLTSNGFSQIVWKDSSRRWVSTRYIADGAGNNAKTSSTTGSKAATSTTSLPKTTGKRRATTALMLRSTSAAKFTNYGDIPKGTIVDITGTTKNGMAEIVWKGQVRWVNNKYLVKTTSAPTKTVAPKSAGQRYTTAILDIRTGSTGSGVIGELPKGTKVDITGKTANGRAEIIYQGTTRWVTAKYLSQSKPAAVKQTGNSKGLSGLTGSCKNIVSIGQANFPQIKTYYGVRADSIPDHPSGRAIDLMIPSYKSNKALGKKIADYYKSRARELNIDYIIWDQHIWSVARSKEGWRYMADRGSDTQNHKDHVHISVKS